MSTPTFIQPPPLALGKAVPPLWVTASLRRRTFAATIDIVITTVAAAIASLPLAPRPFSGQAGLFVSATAESSGSNLLITAIVVANQAVIWIIYAGLLTTRPGAHNGQTLGKQLLGIRAVGDGGVELGRGPAWRRATWTGVMTAIPSIFGLLVDAAFDTAPAASDVGDALSSGVILVAYVTALTEATRRTFYDRSVGTVVVDARPLRTLPAGDYRGGPIEPRSASWVTWVLTTIAFVVVGYLVVFALWPRVG